MEEKIIEMRIKYNTQKNQLFTTRQQEMIIELVKQENEKTNNSQYQKKQILKQLYFILTGFKI